MAIIKALASIVASRVEDPIERCGTGGPAINFLKGTTPTPAPQDFVLGLVWGCVDIVEIRPLVRVNELLT